MKFEKTYEKAPERPLKAVITSQGNLLLHQRDCSAEGRSIVLTNYGKHHADGVRLDTLEECDIAEKFYEGDKITITF